MTPARDETGARAFAPVDPAMTPGTPPAPAPPERAYLSYPPPTGAPFASTTAWSSWTEAPPRRRGRAVAAVTALVLLVVAVVGAAATFGGHGGGSSSRASGSVGSGPDLSAANAEARSHLAELEAFVARDTGHPFTRPVTPEILSGAQFDHAYRASGGGPALEPVGDEDDTGVTLASLGLIASPEKFWGDTQTSGSLAGRRHVDAEVSVGDVLGFYDDTNGRLVVRGTDWTPDVEYTLVHELTHANQDQSFILSALKTRTRTDDETAVTLQSVIEGEAVLVSDDYYRTRPVS